MRFLILLSLGGCTCSPTSSASSSADPAAAVARRDSASSAAAAPPGSEQQVVFETSQSSISPSGQHRVSVSSQRFADGKGLSQAVVSSEMQGSGLIAFDKLRVSMEFVWRSDEELVIRYPSELPPPRIDAMNNTYGFGGRGRVVYEAVPQASIAPLVWVKSGELVVSKEETLERGRLMTLVLDGQTQYSYSYYDLNEKDPSRPLLRDKGFHGGGPSWAGIIHGLVALRAPQLRPQIELDAQSDGLSVRSSSREALVQVATLVAQAKRDAVLLDAAIRRAVDDKEME